MIRAEHLNALIGKKVELVCFAQFSVYIHLQDGTMLTAEAGYEHTHGERRRVYELSAPVEDSSLMSILENAIVSAEVDANGGLCLVISNGDTLHIYKGSYPESWRLKIGKDEFIL